MSSLPAVIPAHSVIPANAGIFGASVRGAEIPGRARDDVFRDDVSSAETREEAR